MAQPPTKRFRPDKYKREDSDSDPISDVASDVGDYQPYVSLKERKKSNLEQLAKKQAQRRRQPTAEEIRQKQLEEKVWAGSTRNTPAR